MSNTTKTKTKATDFWLLRAIIIRAITMPLVLAFLVIGFAREHAALADSTILLHPAAISQQKADTAPAMIAWPGTDAAQSGNVMAVNI